MWGSFQLSSECQGRLVSHKLMKQYTGVLLLSLFKAPNNFFFFETQLNRKKKTRVV